MLRKIANTINNAPYKDDIRRFVELEYKKADHPMHLPSKSGSNSAEIKRRMR